MMSPAQLKFLKIVQEKEFFKNHRKVLIALSGGQDSMTLFNWLYELKEALNIELGIAHVNHGLRAASDHEEQEIRKIAAQRNIPIYVDRFTGQFTEQKGRAFRYQFFKRLMLENGYTALVTAHHKGDVVETVLMREITGRSLRSLQGIAERQPFANGELIRPLLQFEKSELDAPYFFEDYTNHGTDYLRNRIRNQFIPEMNKENPQFSAGILSLSSEISLAMSVITDKIAELNILADKISVNHFCQQSQALQYFILQAYFEQFPDLKISKAKLTELRHIINRPQQYRATLNKNTLFIKNKDKFYVEKNSVSTDKNLIIKKDDPKDASYMRVDLSPTGQIIIRKRQPGDTILINGHHKKLKKYFIDKHISLEQRDSFLIFVENDLYAVVGLVCSDLSKQAKNDKMRRTLWVKPSVREDCQHD